MDHPFAPLMLVGLLREEPPSVVRDRRNLIANRESRRAGDMSLIEQLRVRIRPQATEECRDLACCPA